MTGVLWFSARAATGAVATAALLICAAAPEPATAQTSVGVSTSRPGGFTPPRGDRARPSRPRLSAAQRAENRRLQTFLNGIGCDAGSVDGVFGRRTRAAVRCFQELVGDAVTGRFSQAARETALATHAALYGDDADPFAEAPTPELVLSVYLNGGTVPDGAFDPSDPFASTDGVGGAADALGGAADADGQADASSGADASAGADAFAGAEADVSAGADAAIADGSAEQPADDPAGAGLADLVDDLASTTIGDLFGPADDVEPAQAAVATSAEYCARPRVTAASERFCGERETYMETAADANDAAGRSAEDAAATCAVVGDGLADLVEALPTASIDATRAAVVERLSFASDRRDSFMSSMRICVGAGYATEDDALALAAALALDALGETRATALVGQHLDLGLATEPSPAQAEAWSARAEP